MDFKEKELGKDISEIGEGFVLYFENNEQNILVCKIIGIEYAIESNLIEFAKFLNDEKLMK